MLRNIANKRMEGRSTYSVRTRPCTKRIGLSIWLREDTEGKAREMEDVRMETEEGEE